MISGHPALDRNCVKDQACKHFKTDKKNVVTLLRIQGNLSSTLRQWKCTGLVKDNQTVLETQGSHTDSGKILIVLRKFLPLSLKTVGMLTCFCFCNQMVHIHIYVNSTVLLKMHAEWVLELKHHILQNIHYIISPQIKTWKNKTEMHILFMHKLQQNYLIRKWLKRKSTFW